MTFRKLTQKNKTGILLQKKKKKRKKYNNKTKEEMIFDVIV